MIEDDLARRSLFRLVYASRFAGAERDFDEALRSIIVKSIQNNRMVDITGYLIAGQGRFLQLLEGPEESVRATYHRIGQDARHGGFARISEGPTNRRLFRDWNMGQHRVGAEDRVLAKFGLNVFLPAQLNGDIALRLLAEAGGQHLRQPGLS